MVPDPRGHTSPPLPNRGSLGLLCCPGDFQNRHQLKALRAVFEDILKPSDGGRALCTPAPPQHGCVTTFAARAPRLSSVLPSVCTGPSLCSPGDAGCSQSSSRIPVSSLLPTHVSPTKTRCRPGSRLCGEGVAATQPRQACPSPEAEPDPHGHHMPVERI